MLRLQPKLPQRLRLCEGTWAKQLDARSVFSLACVIDWAGLAAESVLEGTANQTLFWSSCRSCFAAKHLATATPCGFPSAFTLPTDSSSGPSFKLLSPVLAAGGAAFPDGVQARMKKNICLSQSDVPMHGNVTEHFEDQHRDTMCAQSHQNKRTNHRNFSFLPRSCQLYLS